MNLKILVLNLFQDCKFSTTGRECSEIVFEPFGIECCGRSSQSHSLKSMQVLSAHELF